VDGAKVQDERVLLFDDLYRSGATLNAVTEALIASGALAVYALAVTQTRSNA
jgi:predicted amidophosphoribosyltransferase